MLLKNRPDPLFQQALQLKREQCELQSLIFRKISELGNGVGGMSVEVMEEVKTLDDALKAGRGNEVEVREKFEKFKDMNEQAKLILDLKRELKIRKEQEEDLKKKLVTGVF